MAKQAAESQPKQDWSWVESSVWTPRMLSALGNGVKGGKWYSLMDKVYRPATLEKAWRHVRSNRGVAGVDRVSIERFEGGLAHYLKELSEDLRTGCYRPEAVKRVYIPKPDGRRRPLGIPTVKDRVVQMALKMVLEPIFEDIFLGNSYGFRPKRGCKDALRAVDNHLKTGYTWVVDADFKGYFDTIPHARLIKEVQEHVADQKVVQLIEWFLKQDILEDVKRWTPTQGSPQGAVISPLLSNIYLHKLDQTLTQAGYRMVRYADDFVVLCTSQSEAEAALEKIRCWIENYGLELHPEKTHLGDSSLRGQGFEFLGYRFEAGRKGVRKKSLKALKDKIRSKTGRSRGDSMVTIIRDLNPILRGWFEYFKHACRTTFKVVDQFLRRRLRAVRRKQLKRPGFGRTFRDHQRWPNTYFANLGLFTMKEAWEEARQSRCGNS